MPETFKSIDAIRRAAVRQGFLELAIVCGWSLMRMNNELLEAQLKRLQVR